MARSRSARRVAAVLLIHGVHPLLATRRRFSSGTVAGALTGIIHTRFGINRLLSGILVMTALYSINLHVMGRSNVPLLEVRTLATQAEHVARVGCSAPPPTCASGGGTSRCATPRCCCWRWPPWRSWALLIYLFFRTNLGTAMQAAGDNPQMIRALGVNVENMVVLGLAVSNGLVALSGALLAQYQGFADVQMGIGMVVWGLASIIIGEALVGVRQLGLIITGAVMGSVLFRLLVAIALRGGLNPNDLKLVTAVFVFLALVLPGLVTRLEQRQAQAPGGGAVARCSRSTPIRKTFNPDTPNEVRALQGVNLALDEGTFVVVIGTNGSGKSTLLNALAGSFIVDEGSIVLDGTDITRWPEHRRAKFIGRVFQNPFSGTAPRMTIAENLVLAARRGQPRGLGWALKANVRQQLRDRVSHLRLGLEDRLDNSIGSLSGGQRQALTLLMASWLRPQAAAARRAHRRARSAHGRSRHQPERGDRLARQADHADGDALHAAGHQPRRPADHDAPRIRAARLQRRREAAAAARPICWRGSRASGAPNCSTSRRPRCSGEPMSSLRRSPTGGQNQVHRSRPGTSVSGVSDP